MKDGEWKGREVGIDSIRREKRREERASVILRRHIKCFSSSSSLTYATRNELDSLFSTRIALLFCLPHFSTPIGSKL